MTVRERVRRGLARVPGGGHPGPADGRDGPGLPALPRDRAGVRGRLLHAAVAAAARARALRRRRLRRRLARARHGRAGRLRRSGRMPSRFLTESSVDERHPADRQRRARQTGASTSSRSGSCCRCGRGRGRSTSSSTPSRSCTARAGCAASSAPARCQPEPLLHLASSSASIVIPLVLIGPALLADLLPAAAASSSTRSTGRSWSSSRVGQPRRRCSTSRRRAGRRGVRDVPGARAGAGDLGARLVRPAGPLGSVRRRRSVDLRPAVGAHRAAHLAVRPGHRRAHRRRPQRRDRARCGRCEERLRSRARLVELAARPEVDAAREAGHERPLDGPADAVRPAPVAHGPSQRAGAGPARRPTSPGARPRRRPGRAAQVRGGAVRRPDTGGPGPVGL